LLHANIDGLATSPTWRSYKPRTLLRSCYRDRTCRCMADHIQVSRGPFFVRGIDQSWSRVSSGKIPHAFATPLFSSCPCGACLLLNSRQSFRRKPGSKCHTCPGMLNNSSDGVRTLIAQSSHVRVQLPTRLCQLELILE
jgi:hypothetical protein